MAVNEFKILRENLKLNILTHYVNDPQAILIHLHGLHSTFQFTCDTPDEFENRIKILGKKKILSYALEFSGHGKSDGKPAYINNLDDLQKDLDSLINYIYNYHNLEETKIPIFLLGESMGGSVAIKYSYYNKKIKGIILLAPLIKISNLPNNFICKSLVNLSYLIPSLNINNFRRKKQLSTNNDEYNAKKIENKYNNSHKLTMCSIRECHLFYDWVKDIKLDIPLLIFQSKYDNCTDYNYTEKFFKNSITKNKELITFMDTNHCLLINSHKEDSVPYIILNKILNWINMNIN